MIAGAGEGEMDAGPRHRETGVRRRQSAPRRLDAQDRDLNPRIFICPFKCLDEEWVDDPITGDSAHPAVPWIG